MNGFLLRLRIDLHLLEGSILSKIYFGNQPLQIIQGKAHIFISQGRHSL